MQGRKLLQDAVPFGLLFAEKAVQSENPIVGYDEEEQVGIYAKEGPQFLGANVTTTVTAFNDQDWDE